MSESMNWKKMTDETVNNLVKLIREATINPPGNELPAILVVKDILEAAGVPAEMYQIVESAPNRANLVARLEGDGSARPLLLSGHVDVVPVERERWSHDPFGGEVIDGMVWGRGSLDMKGFLAMYLEVFLELFRRKVPLKRDVILAAISDEENGFNFGSKFLVERHRELIDAEYGFTEAGGMTITFGKYKVYPIQVAEKAMVGFKASAYGKPGHGSIPHADNPVFFLAQALEKLRRAGHLPVHLTPTFLKMVDALGAQAPFPINILARLLHSPQVMGILLDALPGEGQYLLRALTTNTISPTLLQAGNKLNVIPSVAEAGIDCRVVPGQSPESVMHEIHHIVGNQIKLETVYTIGGAEFSTETALFRLMEKKARQMDPTGLVIPMLMPGATDACQYQKAGIIMYGFTPGVLPRGMELMQLAHGHDERMPVSFIESGLPVLWDVVTEFCGQATN
jgi:acetylornithine deacetylase/succinyl-diaminopimelate desuccinylase-like protein